MLLPARVACTVDSVGFSLYCIGHIRVSCTYNETVEDFSQEYQKKKVL